MQQDRVVRPPVPAALVGRGQKRDAVVTLARHASTPRRSAPRASLCVIAGSLLETRGLGSRADFAAEPAVTVPARGVIRPHPHG